MSGHSAEKDVRCDGHYGAGSLREWAECPLCNPGESSVLPPGVCMCPEPAAIGTEPCDTCGLPATRPLPPEVIRP